MFQKLKNKFTSVKNAVVVASVMAVTTDVFAQAPPGGASADASLTKITGTMKLFRDVLPIGSQIAGVIIIIGGLWSMYQHYKSDGRDGSIAAGIAGVLIGAALFFLGGLLKLSAGVVGVEQSSCLPGSTSC